jgi:hypothetical protein
MRQMVLSIIERAGIMSPYVERAGSLKGVLNID